MQTISIQNVNTNTGKYFNRIGNTPCKLGTKH